MFSSLPGLLPISRLDQPSPQGLIIDPNPILLYEFLGGQAWTKILILRPIKLDDFVPDLIGYPTFQRPTPGLVDDSPDPFTPYLLDDPSNLPTA